MDPRFAHIRDWIFDLDNCLYPASTGLFDLIDQRMGAFIERLLGVDPVRARLWTFARVAADPRQHWTQEALDVARRLAP